MITPQTQPKASAPSLTPEELKGLQDYWNVLEAHREEITRQLLYMAEGSPELKSVLQNSSLQQTTEQQQAGIERQRRAIFHNEWEPYLENLREQGTRYAQAGLNFSAWFEIISAFRKYMRPYLLQAYAEDSTRVLTAMEGI